jgi:hypothetical protein
LSTKIDIHYAFCFRKTVIESNPFISMHADSSGPLWACT